MVGKLSAMKLLRQNTRLAWLLATLFVAQFFVPLALASLRSDADNVGIVICTSSGLKKFTPNGESGPRQNGEQQVGQKDCLVCLTNGLSGSADLPPSPTTKIVPVSASILTRYYSDIGFLSGAQTKNFKARAPPVKN